MEAQTHSSREGRAFALVGRIAAVAAEATELEAALGNGLAELCDHTGWPIGHAALVRGGTLHGTPVWYGADDPKVAPFRQASEELRGRAGEGLSGRVLETGRPAWVVDIARDPSFVRRRVAVEAGIRTALAFPLLADGEVTGVLELFTPQLVEPQEELLGLLRLIGVELGRMTGRARAEAMLGEGEERYRLLFESATDAIFLESADGRILAVNPAAERLTGYSASELAGQDVSILLAPEYVELSRHQLDQKLAGTVRETRHESVIVDRNGRRIAVDVVSVLVKREGVVVGLQVVVRNLDQQRRAELALRESEERFRGAFDAAAVGMALASIDGRWLKVNAALCEIVGYSADELLEMSFQELTFPDDLEPDIALGRKMLAGEVPNYQMEKRYIRKDGSIVWIHLSVSLVRDADGTPAYSVVQVLDIMERKLAELDTKAQVSERPAAGTLSPRERQVLSLLADGRTSAEAASALGIGEETVQTHVRRAMAKLSARTRTEAVAISLRHGLLDLPAAAA